VASVNDVAAAILERGGTMTAMKLQKLVYYSQAWHAVWDEEQLFPSEIEAWRNGPVCRDLYEGHRGMFQVSTWPRGNSESLARNESETVDVIVGSYGRLSGQQLSDLTHSERPWVEARAGCSPDERSSAPITLESMVDYYSSLGADAVDVEPF
jgi:uncharacterized phage-associated protein